MKLVEEIPVHERTFLYMISMALENSSSCELANAFPKRHEETKERCHCYA